MSSPELSNDEYEYENYSIESLIESYQDEDGPPLISKKARLLTAATQNDVETLKQLLDSPKWYNVRDKSGFNLLQIAILTESDNIFDYLLSLDGFPLEAVDDVGSTALVVSLSYFMSNETSMGDRYAFELIKKGADIDKRSREGEPLLHCALQRGFVRVARLLIERGANVNMLNDDKETPLHKCVYCNYNLAEAVSMLLCYGADPSVCDNLDRSFLDNVLNFRYGRDDDLLVVQEIVLNFTVDEWSSHKISGLTLLNLAQKKSPLFYQMVKFTSEIIFEDSLYFYCHYLFTIDLEYLRVLLEKYPCFVEELLQSYSERLSNHPESSTFDLNNFDVLLQSSLCSDAIIELISNLNTSKLIPNILDSGKNIEEVMEMIYYLLSYGMSLKEKDLENIYKKTGYSEDFKNLLFMEVQKQIGEKIRDVMPRLIYDVTLDMHKIVEEPYLCEFINWDQIFHYFIHPKIQDVCHRIKPIDAIGRQLPQIPLLQELARDAFRKYFLKRFEITTAKRFYTLIKVLPVSSVHKKIITFESKLY